MAGVVLELPEPRPLLLLEVAERADRRHRGAVGERDLDDGEGAVLADEAKVLDRTSPSKGSPDAGPASNSASA